MNVTFTPPQYATQKISPAVTDSRMQSQPKNPLPVKKRRRGTAIIQNSQGAILLVVEENGMLLLPGGGCDRGESRRNAACRELYEETGVTATDSRFLFSYLEQGEELYDMPWGETIQNDHSVFQVRIEGEPTPSDEITGVRWWQPGEEVDNFSKSSFRIIQKFLAL